MANYDVSLIDQLELETNYGKNCSVAVLDATHVAVAYIDGDNDCQLDILSHDADGDNIAEEDTIEVNTNCAEVAVCKMPSVSRIMLRVCGSSIAGLYLYSYDGSYNISLEDSATAGDNTDFPAIVGMSSTHVITAMQNDTYSNGYLSSYTIESDNITTRDGLAVHNPMDWSALCKCGDYAVLFYDDDDNSYIRSYSFDVNYDITEESNYRPSTENGDNFHDISELKSGYFVYEWCGYSGPAYVGSGSINVSTGAIAEIDKLQITTSNGTEGSLAVIDDNYFAVAYENSDDEIELDTYYIDGSGDNIAVETQQVFSTDRPVRISLDSIKDSYLLRIGWEELVDSDIQFATGLVELGVETSDSVLITISESSGIEVQISTSDIILPMVSENSTVQVLISSSDELLPKITDVSNRIIASILQKQDELLPKISEDKQINVSFSTSDTIYVYLEDTNDLLNLNTLMNATIRQILGKVEITYSNPFEDEEITISVSNDTTEDHTDLYNLSNSITSPGQKRFNLHNNSLDGTFYPMPSEQNSKNGWWGTTLSDGSGEFTTDPVITFEFGAKTITKLELYGDDKLNNYPVDFTFRLYSAGDVLEHTEPVTSNASSYWSTTVNESDIVKMTLTISKISQANSTIKLYEVYTSIVEEYLEDDLFSIELLEELEYNSGTLAIGNISSNEIKVVLNNANNIFSPLNEDSPLHTYIKKNRRIQAWLGVEIVPDTFEWHSLGVFWSDEWKVDDNEIDAQVVGLDKLELLRKSDFSISTVYEDYTLKDLAEVVFADAGLTSAEYSIDSDLDIDTIPYAWFDRMSHRAALKKIAEAGLAVVYCDREGIIVMEKIDTSGSTLFDFNEDNYYERRQSTTTEMINYVEVRAEPRIEGIQEVVYEDYESFDIAAGESVTKTHFFNFIPVIDAQQPTIEQSGADIVVDSYTAYAWGMEVTYKNNGGTQQTVTEIEIQGKKLDVAGGKVAIAQDEDSIADNGKLALSSPVVSELIQTIDQAQDIADDLLAVYSDPYRDVRLQIRGHIALKIGDLVTVPENEDLEEYIIVRQHIRWDGALEAAIDVQKTGG